MPSPDKLKLHGLTLIELLVVVVIISILSGITITVINPVKFINKSKDTNTATSLRKMGTSVKSKALYNKEVGTVTNIIPSINQIFDSIANVEDEDTSDPDLDLFNCSPGSMDQLEGWGYCFFSLEGIDLPNNCSSDEWSGLGDTPCKFVLMRRSQWQTPNVSCPQGCRREYVTITARTHQNSNDVYVYVFSVNYEDTTREIKDSVYMCNETNTGYDATNRGSPESAGCVLTEF